MLSASMTLALQALGLSFDACVQYTDNQFKTLKVLSIGNSFSVDAMKYLYQIAQDRGYTNIVLGNLYIGGCSLKRHWNNAENDKPEYTYYKNISGKWFGLPSKTLLQGLTDEAWDYISLQQASRDSGIEESYDFYLENMIAYVNKYKSNRSAKLVWHMTWAYQHDCERDWFDNYERDQMTMYNAIISAVKSKVVPTGIFSLIIPTGTAIQNVRSSFIGDVLTRDGFHLSLKLGRYIAGLVWFHAITGESIDDIAYTPDVNEVPFEFLPVLIEAVKNAVISPYIVTAASPAR